MDLISDTSVFLAKCSYYFLECLVYKIIPKRKKNVAGEIVLITGAGSGLGRLMAIKFASLGAIVVLWDINEEGNMETCRLAKEKGGEKVFAYKCDCSNREEVYRVADQVKKDVGDVTLLINNAGVVTGKMFLNTPDDMIERSFRVNALSHFWTCKAFLPAMIKANHGHLVCISSVAGLIGINVLSDYSSSKFAAFGLAESLMFELELVQKTNVKTTIVCPFLIKTGMFDGATSKFPHLLPLLEQEYVSQKIVNAILEEQTYLLMPKFIYLGMILKQILSSKMLIAFLEYLGVDTFMNSFRGREQVQTETEKQHQS
ncbi:short-chain dehydrogenase/reductase family 16C member 6-like [Sturnira hondurensis]|uniref:short-chain dehydrogenase/reductase family 16C member 6-like n=1 Tax=Sturnira hondurensis TaxID=192404 RepID=UPI00187A2B83|nr:short-chain dehydrogenase/reductase family 16C member 6-like [Sturnira hondurensis]